MDEESLTAAQKKKMYQSGFLISEIKAFANARTPDNKSIQNFKFDSAPVQDMIKSRANYVSKLHKLGWTDLQIRNRINMLYIRKRGKMSPFDFLKIEYRPPTIMSDITWSTKMKARSKISRALGTAYSTPIKKEVRPRYKPVVRELPPMPN